MKRTIFTLALGAVLMAGFPAMAETFDVGPFTYETIGDGNVKVSKVITLMEDMTIPAKVENGGTTYNVTTVGALLFYGKNTVKNLVIEDGVSIIEQSAFLNLQSLRTVKFPSTLKSLGTGCFFGTGLLKIELPEGLTSIGSATFRMCTKLSEVKLPSTLKTTDGLVFASCTSLRTMECKSKTPPAAEPSDFSEMPLTTATLTVPIGSIELYRSAKGWNGFANIVSPTIKGASIIIAGRVGNKKVASGKPIEMAFSLTNGGSEDVTSLTYEYTINGESKSVDLTLPTPIKPAATEDVTLTFDAIAQEGDYEMTLTVPKVNGQANASGVEPYTFTFTVGTVLVLPDNAVPFSYFTGEGASNYLGSGEGGQNAMAAMRITDPSLVGKKIVGIKVSYLQSYGIDALTGWLSSTLEGKPDILTVKGEPEGTSALMVLKEPYEIPAEGVYVGYDILSQNPYPIPFADPAGIPDSFYYRTKTDGKVYDGMDGYGCATITAYVTGDFTDNAAGVLYDADGMVMPGDAFPVTFVVRNDGLNAISTVNYTYTLNGTSVEGEANVNLPAKLGAKKDITLNLAGLPSAGTYPLVFTVTKVNNVENTSALGTGTAPIRALSFRPTNRPLMEEGTGTWCVWCTRGWVGMKEMNERYKDFIGVAWHNGDPMTIVEEIPFKVKGYPGAAINRTLQRIDPYYGPLVNGQGENFGIYNTYAKIAENLAPADIELSTTWNEDKSQLKVNAMTKFAGEFDGYTLGYILGQDGYCYPEDENWNQRNSYAGNQSYINTYLNIVCEQPDPIVGLVFDDVVINADAARGVEQSLPANTEQDKSYNTEYTFNTSSILGIIDYSEDTANGGYELATNKDKMFVVAYILNKKGQVLNARKVKAGEATAQWSSIDNLEVSPAVEAEYYNLMGQRVMKPVAGELYIKVQGKKATKIVM